MDSCRAATAPFRRQLPQSNAVVTEHRCMELWHVILASRSSSVGRCLQALNSTIEVFILRSTWCEVEDNTSKFTSSSPPTSCLRLHRSRPTEARALTFRTKTLSKSLTSWFVHLGENYLLGSPTRVEGLIFCCWTFIYFCHPNYNLPDRR